MIHYELRCASGHGFDGWFPSSAAFDRQAGLGLLGCPMCASSEVRRAIMAPRVASGRAVATGAMEVPGATHGPEGGRPDRAPGGGGAAGGAMVAGKAAGGERSGETAVTPALPDQVRAVLQRLRATVEQNCDYVGPEFAAAARAMHEGSVDKRAIYGETTESEAEALAEDGIDVSRIPWIPRADS